MIQSSIRRESKFVLNANDSIERPLVNLNFAIFCIAVQFICMHARYNPHNLKNRLLY